MEIKITETLDAGGDVLIVRGMVDGVAHEARGWMSALTNHYDAKDYVEIPAPSKKVKHGKAHGRHLRSSAKPREMTKKERQAYCEQLLRERAEAHAAPEPKAVKLF
jgi:hypothetical protein